MSLERLPMMASWRADRVRAAAGRGTVAALALTLCIGGPTIVAQRVAMAAATLDARAPTIQIQRILATRRDLGRGGLIRRISARPDPELFARPFGVAWDGSDLVISDPGAGMVRRITARGRIRESPPNLFSSPIGVAVCSMGIAVADSRLGRVAILDGDLHRVRWLASGLRRPTGVACENGEVFIAETGRHRLLRLLPQPTTADTGAWGPLPHDAAVRIEDGWTALSLGRFGEAAGEFSHPTALVLDGESLWVGDTLNFRIQRLEAASGAHRVSFGELGDTDGEMPRIKGIAVDSERRLWVSDGYLNKIALYDQDGTFLAALGGLGSEPGRFSFPAGLAANANGSMAIVDSLNRRVQILRLATAPGSRPRVQGAEGHG
jgi:hypothetical protein